MLEAHANVNVVIPEDTTYKVNNVSPIHIAAMNRDFNMTTLLISKGANIEAVIKTQQTAKDISYLLYPDRIKDCDQAVGEGLKQFKTTTPLTSIINTNGSNPTKNNQHIKDIGEKQKSDANLKITCTEETPIQQASKPKTISESIPPLSKGSKRKHNMNGYHSSSTSISSNNKKLKEDIDSIKLEKEVNKLIANHFSFKITKSESVTLGR